MTAPAVTPAFGMEDARQVEVEARRLAFPPKPQLTVSEWADRYRVLSGEASAEPGRWRTLKYQRAIMDAVHRYNEVVAMLPSQVGKTEIGLNILAYFMDAEPSPILMVQPTEAMAKTVAKDRIVPMIRDTPQLRRLFPGLASARREADQTLLHRSFPAGHLTLTGCSPANVASRPIRVLDLDEIDRFPTDGRAAEGDFTALAEKRTTTFGPRRVVYKSSTPTIQGLSAIERAYEQSNQSKFLIPCPACGHAQEWLWRHLKWESGKPETAAIVCEGPECGVLISEQDKNRQVELGEWVATFPDRDVAGFHCTALVSPLISWQSLVREWYAAQGNPERLRVFTNTVWAETWRESGEEISQSMLEARREDYQREGVEVPAEAGLVTMYTDVQADRLECMAVGWGAGERSWMLYFEQLWGDPGKRDVWDKLALVVGRKFRHANGQELPIRGTGIDSGGHHTQQVYDFVRRMRGHGVYATKGVGGAGRPLVGRPSKANKQKVNLFPVGVDTAKDLIFSRLKIQTPGPGYIHLPTWADNELLAQITAERVVTRFHKGRPKREYIKVRHRNEALDLLVGNLATLVILGPIREQLGAIVAQLQPLSSPGTERDAGDPETDAPVPARPRRPSRRPAQWATGGGAWGL
jgi:phage terminase large subunit GpA-like protein